MKSYETADELIRTKLLFRIGQKQGHQAMLWAKQQFKTVKKCALFRLYRTVCAHQKEIQKQFLVEMKELLIASSNENMLKETLFRVFHCQEIETHNELFASVPALTERYSIALSVFPYTQQQMILFHEIFVNSSSDTFEMHKQNLLSIHDSLIKTLNTQQFRLVQLENLLNFSTVKSSKCRVKTLQNFLKSYEIELQEKCSSIASELKTFNEPDHSQNPEKNKNFERDLVYLYSSL